MFPSLLCRDSGSLGLESGLISLRELGRLSPSALFAVRTLTGEARRLSRISFLGFGPFVVRLVRGRCRQHHIRFVFLLCPFD